MGGVRHHQKYLPLLARKKLLSVLVASYGLHSQLRLSVLKLHVVQQNGEARNQNAEWQSHKRKEEGLSLEYL